MILCVSHLYSLGQDYLIYKGTKTPIYTYPLDQYSYKMGPGFVDYSRTRLSLHNSRGYNATWEIKNDSLYLFKITYPSRDTISTEQIISNPDSGFAHWFNGELHGSDGQAISDAEHHYSPIYQFSKTFYLENGRVVKTETGSNQKRANEVNTSLRMNRLAKDTVFFTLKKLNWVKLDEEDCLYDQGYCLIYNRHGKLKKVNVTGGFLDKKEVRKENWENRKARRLIRKTVRKVNLSYLKPLANFKLFIEIWYDSDTQILELENR